MCVICFCVNKNINISIKPKTIFSIVKRVYNNKKKKNKSSFLKLFTAKKYFILNAIFYLFFSSQNSTLQLLQVFSTLVPVRSESVFLQTEIRFPGRHNSFSRTTLCKLWNRKISLRILFVIYNFQGILRRLLPRMKANYFHFVKLLQWILCFLGSNWIII